MFRDKQGTTTPVSGWRKSSRSNASGDCAEVAAAAGRVLVRDSKDRDGPVLGFTPGAWRSLSDRLKAGAGM